MAFPDPPPEGASLDEIESYLDQIRGTPATGDIVLNGYTFHVRFPPLPPFAWILTASSPEEARDTVRVRSGLGMQWCWDYVIDTIKAEINRVMTAVPSPDPGPWPP